MKIKAKTQAALNAAKLAFGARKHVTTIKADLSKTVKTEAKTGKAKKTAKAVKDVEWTAQAWRKVKELDQNKGANSFSLCNMRSGDAKLLQIVDVKGDGVLKGWIVTGARGERGGINRFSGNVAHLGNGKGVDFGTFKNYMVADVSKVIAHIRKNGTAHDSINYDGRTFKGHVLNTAGDFYEIFTDGKSIFKLEAKSLGKKNAHLLYSLGK